MNRMNFKVCKAAAAEDVDYEGNWASWYGPKDVGVWGTGGTEPHPPPSLSVTA